MHITKAWLAAALAALCTCGCGRGPTAPDPQLNSFNLSAHMVNASGAPTILDAQLQLDGAVVDEDSLATGFADAGLGAGSTIDPGSHTLAFLLVGQTTAAANYYTVPKFDVTLFSCDGGVFSDNGSVSRTIHLHTQTVSLAAGQAITYSFDSPDCTLDSQNSAKARRLLPPRSGPAGVKPLR
jgi:hypothetical protein